jgi:nitrilase
VAFSETFIPGFPRHVGAAISAERRRALSTHYLDQAVEIGGPETTALCAAAREHHVDVVIGIAELDPNTHGSTYCTLLFVGADGSILGRHRKLKPTDAERTVWADGDAVGLQSWARPYARISGLNCWEHNMVLPGYALIQHGTQCHVAAFPGHEPQPPAVSRTRQLLLSRAFASQAASYVVLVGGLLRPDDITSPDLADAVRELPPMSGDSYVIDPFGEVIAGPAVGEQILFAECSLDRVRAAKAVCDSAGHYSRPDIFRLDVRRGP